MEESVHNKNVDIVVVENNKIIGKLIEKLIGNVYNVHIYTTAKSAIYQLERDLKPFCVISTFQLPDIDGVELLVKVDKISPKSVRILLTSVTETRELVDIIRKAKVNYYIKKPFNNLDFLQIVRVASTIYELNKENESINKIKSKFYSQYNDLLKSIDSQNKTTDTLFKNFLRTISTFIYKAERFHFRNHSKGVLNISTALATDLGVDDDSIKNIFHLTEIISHYKIGLPDKYKLLDPRMIDNEAQKHIFTTHFKESLASLISLPSIKSFAETAGKLFENIDGTGFPFGLSGIDLPREIQIINIVNSYYHGVYCLRPEDLFLLKSKGIVTQTKAETLKRHKDCITWLYKNLKWYDHDLFYRFQDMLKKRNIDELEIKEEDLIIKYSLSDFGIPKDSKEKKEVLTREINSTQSIVEVKDQNGSTIEKYLKKKVSIAELKESDFICEPVKTYSEATIIKPNTKVTSQILANLEKYLSRGTIQDSIFIRKDEY